MKKILLLFLFLVSFQAFSQGQFDDPSFTFNGQIYRVRKYNHSIMIRNSNQTLYGSGSNLRVREVERYCSDTEFPVKYKDIGDKLVALNPVLFSQERRLELKQNKDMIDLTLIASAETRQIVEVVFWLNSNTILTREEIYRMEQAYKTLKVALYPYNPNNCTFNYLVVNIVIFPHWD
jgi:hypothetical protein